MSTPPINFSEGVSIGTFGELKLGDGAQLSLIPAWTT